MSSFGTQEISRAISCAILSRASNFVLLLLIERPAVVGDSVEGVPKGIRCEVESGVVKDLPRLSAILHRVALVKVNSSMLRPHSSTSA